MESHELEPEELQVITPENKRSGVYANITNISDTGNELILNFIFANAADTPHGTLVSRVIVTRKHAEQIQELLKEIINTANEINP